ncbi:MAG: DUF4058 family protein [bacterium]|nr:DUF4058 family protein [bacterium]
MGSDRQAYIARLLAGPFDGLMDPWAEQARYFQQIHGGMIGDLMAQLLPELAALGYFATAEASLQIAEGRKPDISVMRVEGEQSSHKLNYTMAAAQAAVQPGVAIEETDPEQEAIYIREIGSGTLVTVIEVISPRNKSHRDDLTRYQAERGRLFLERGVHVVEIDLTRSINRMLEHTLTLRHHYHIAVFVAGDVPYVIVNDWGQALAPFAVPLREEVVVVNPHRAYTTAYQQKGIALQIEQETGYDDAALPNPRSLSDAQREQARQAVSRWREDTMGLQSS